MTQQRVKEKHLVERVGWLRAAIMGANDGIVSIASLIVGVAAANPVRGDVLLAGIAGLMAGAMSMAAGEYVSVSSQSDTEKADLARERHEHEIDPEGELIELAGIYQSRGLDAKLALTVARQMMDGDGIAAHARDELGLSPVNIARPLQAAATSALMFALGAALPLVAVLWAPVAAMIPAVGGAALLALAILGGFGAHIGGAPKIRAIVRVVFWGGVAMVATAAIGRLVGTVV
ncbi:membrane protein [Thalassospira profundimaris]|uniref:Membrane protein n=1 Tax=Thalassospira profundimaris TaxID=502049 RepID=A0A367X4C7_9PROT|nr:VIT family protein [Thalassospira profundimaris]RCK48339.1 membrane protein [Thalassospira profundimaris]